ncbi:MAG TPA: PIN domain-containing protein, partial [Burkholderiales bacterium]|nr:PIN domain-containing protein [Burkholderiales bacterium]
VLRALAYPKVRKLIRGDVEPGLWFEDIVVLADLVAGEGMPLGVCKDPDDDKYIAAAIEGRAAVIVTGDRGLVLKEHQGIRIVTPREFLDVSRTVTAGSVISVAEVRILFGVHRRLIKRLRCRGRPAVSRDNACRR